MTDRILPNSNAICVDVETYDPLLLKSGISCWRGQGDLLGVAIYGGAGTKSTYYGLQHNGGNVENPAQWLAQFAAEAKEYKGIIVGHNLRYDLSWLWCYGVSFPKATYYCTRCIEGLLHSEAESLSLKNTATRYGVGNKLEPPVAIDRIREVSADKVAMYAEEDAKLSLAIMEAHKKDQHYQKALPAIRLECDTYKALFYMTAKGVKVDTAYAEGYRAKLETIVSDAKKQLNIETLTSEKDMTALFSRLGIQSPKQTESGKPSYDKETLAQFAHLPQIYLLLEARSKQTLVGFVNSLLEYAHNGRIHSVYRQEGGGRKGESMGSRYGRLSCEQPNLQQSASDPEYRNMFVPTKCLWVSADFSQQEPRQAVSLACAIGLPSAAAWRDRYKQNPQTDIYEAMREAAGVERKQAKICFLALMYGMGAKKTTAQLGMNEQEGRKFINDFYRYVEFVPHLKKVVTERLTKTDTLYTALGRPYKFGEADNLSFPYKALNRLVQGNSSEQIKLSLLELHKQGFDVIANVHDEHCVDAPYEAMQDIKAAMEKPARDIDKHVPAWVDVAAGATWGKAME